MSCTLRSLTQADMYLYLKANSFYMKLFELTICIFAVLKALSGKRYQVLLHRREDKYLKCYSILETELLQAAKPIK